jgi:glutamine synthetase
MVICDLSDDKTQTPISVAPRSILNKQIAEASKAGYLAQGASELEYFIFDETYKSARSKDYNNLNYFGDYIEDYHILQGTRRFERGVADVRTVFGGIHQGEWGQGSMNSTSATPTR